MKPRTATIESPRRSSTPVAKQKILVVDDEPDALELIKVNLSGAGYFVATAEEGNEALRKARDLRPDLILLDVMLPEIDGLEVCKILRHDPMTGDVPIILLTARATEFDRILGLELGADDYVTKPFSPRELVLRVKSLLRRGKVTEDSSEQIRIGTLLIDIPRHSVRVEDRPIDLTVTEFELLTTLVQRRGRVLSRELLLRDIWDNDTVVDSRTVDTHMRRLREKLGAAACHLDTVRGVGYRFVED
jgi:DNA-binding response OmpR family regulator